MIEYQKALVAYIEAEAFLQGLETAGTILRSGSVEGQRKWERTLEEAEERKEECLEDLKYQQNKALKKLNF